MLTSEIQCCASAGIANVYVPAAASGLPVTAMAVEQSSVGLSNQLVPSPLLHVRTGAHAMRAGGVVLSCPAPSSFNVNENDVTTAPGAIPDRSKAR